MRLLQRIITVIFFGSWALGQSIVGLDPSNKVFHVTPGQTITQSVAVYNPNEGAESFKINAYLADFTYNPFGEIQYANSGTYPESASKWLTVSPSTVELKGQDRQQVQYTMTVPANAKPGTYWVMLMFEAQAPNAQPGQLAAFRTRVAHTVWVFVDPTVNKGEISGIFDQQPKNENQPVYLGVQYNNTGSAATGVQGRIELRNEQGDLVQTVPLKLEVSLPGRSVLLQTPVSGLKKGKYFALAVLSNGSKDQDVVGEYNFDVPFDLKGDAVAATGSQP